MGAVAVNGASKDISDPAERAKSAVDGWARWSPVAIGAIAAHMIGGLGLILANRDRVRNQDGVTGHTVIKAVLTGAAVGATAYSGILGAHLDAEDPAPVTSGTVPNSRTPHRLATTQQQLRVLQWVTPALTGAIIVLGAQQGEQQKPRQVASGTSAKARKRARSLINRSPLAAHYQTTRFATPVSPEDQPEATLDRVTLH